MLANLAPVAKNLLEKGGFNMLGDGLRDTLDPRMRKRL